MLCIAAHTSVPPDPTLTVDNVTRVINMIEGHKAWVLEGVIPISVVDEIQRYSTDAVKNEAYADYIVNVWPDASWYCLTSELYVENKLAAARESKSFMSRGKFCHQLIYFYAHC